MSHVDAPMLGSQVLAGATFDAPAFRERARDAWQILRRMEMEAEILGGRELYLVLSCAREVLERRWGRFEM